MHTALAGAEFLLLEVQWSSRRLEVLHDTIGTAKHYCLSLVAVNFAEAGFGDRIVTNEAPVCTSERGSRCFIVVA